MGEVVPSASPGMEPLPTSDLGPVAKVQHCHVCEWEFSAGRCLHPWRHPCLKESYYNWCE
jgi:hypothetical protein